MKVLRKHWLRLALSLALVLGIIVGVALNFGNAVTVKAMLGIISISLGDKPQPPYTIETKGPTANSGASWSNPTNAYTDGTNYASITSGAPSGNNVWGNFQLNAVTDPVSNVKVRYDAYYGSINAITFRNAGAKASGTGAVTPALPASMSADDIVILTATTIAGGSISITDNGSIAAWTAVTGSPIDVIGGDKLYVWWGRYASGSTGPTVTPGGDHICAGTTAWANVSTGTPIEAQNTGTETTSDTSLSFFTNFSTTSNGAMVILVSSSGADTTTAQHSNQANSSLTSIVERQDYETNSGGGGGFEVVEGYKATAGTAGTWTATLATVSPKAYISFAFTPVDAPDQIRVDVSWDGGGNWSSRQVTTLTSGETTYWYDVTSATSWTAAKLADGQLQVRVDANAVGTANEVRLDYIAVEATYGSVSTRDPSANSGASWTNPQNAYTDGTNYASITSGNPSGSNSWGNYNFSVTGYEIQQVRVRYDAYSAGYSAGATSDTKYPTSDNLTTGYAPDPASPATIYDKVNESGSPDHTKFAVGQTNAGATLLFNYTAFTVPSTATVNWVRVAYYTMDNASGTNNVTSCIRVGSTNYAGATVLPGASWTSQTDNWTTNPGHGGAAWTPADVNGTSSWPLNNFGTTSGDFNPDVDVDTINITVNYTPALEYDDQIKVDVSWDNGSHWSATQNTTLTSAEVTTWYDVTAATTWTPAKLANGQLLVRALAQTVNNAEEVRLDWLPVEVTYSVSQIENAPTSKDFGLVNVSDVIGTGLDYFTLTNSGSVMVDIAVSGTNMTGGTQWTLADNATPDTNTVGFKAGTSPATISGGFSGGDQNATGGFAAGDLNNVLGAVGQGGYEIIVKQNTTYNTLIYRMPISAIYKWGLEIYVPTGFTDTTQKTGTITLIASASP